MEKERRTGCTEFQSARCTIQRCFDCIATSCSSPKKGNEAFHRRADIGTECFKDTLSAFKRAAGHNFLSMWFDRCRDSFRRYSFSLAAGRMAFTCFSLSNLLYKNQHYCDSSRDKVPATAAEPCLKIHILRFQKRKKIDHIPHDRL